MTFDEIYNTLKIDTSFLTSGVYQNIKEQLRTNTLPNGDNRYIGFIEFKQNRILIYTNQTNNTLRVCALPNFQLSVKSDKIYTYDNLKDWCLQEFYQQIKLHLAYVINYELLNENIDSIDLIYPQVLIINTNSDTPPYTPPKPKPPKPVDKTYKLSELYPTQYMTITKIRNPQLLQKRINVNTELRRMFYGCAKLKKIPIFDTKNITNTVMMFSDCKSLEEAPHIDTSNVTNMIAMFGGCKSLKSVPLFNTSKCQYFDQMFIMCTDLERVPLLDTSNATGFIYMFSMDDHFYTGGSTKEINKKESKLKNVPSFDLSRARDTRWMFRDCSSLQSVPAFNTSNVREMEEMFNGCISLKYVSMMDTHNVYNMKRMFCMNDWKYSNGYDKQKTNKNTALKTIPQFDTSNVTDMQEFLSGCAGLTEIPQFNTVKVTNMLATFGGCESIKTIPEMDTSNVTTMNKMFVDCYNLTTIPQLNTSNVTDMERMFFNCYNLINIPLLDTSNVTNMDCMFAVQTDYIFNIADGKNFNTTLKLIPNLNTRNVTSMLGMFINCHGLQTIPPLNTSQVENMYLMFCNCINLTSVPQIDTSKVTNFQYMFYNCEKLNNIPIFDISSITEARAVRDMFEKTKITSVTFRNKPNNIEITSKLLCGEENQITINYI